MNFDERLVTYDISELDELALLLAWTKDIKLIRRSYAAKIKNKKLYAVQFARILAFTAKIMITLDINGMTGTQMLFETEPHELEDSAEV